MRVPCPWCPSGTVRSDLLVKHLRRAHGLGVIEADEIGDRLRGALADLPPIEAAIFAFTGMKLPPLNAREVLADLRRNAQAGAIRGRPWRWRASFPLPLGYHLCLACQAVVPQEDMARRADGGLTVICQTCHAEFEAMRVPGC